MTKPHLWIIGALCLSFAAAVPAKGQPPIWTVQGPHARLLMFGSVHILPAGIAWMPRALTQALQKGDEVWFEIPVDPAAQAQAAEALLARGALPAGDSLFAHLSPDQNARLRRACALLRTSPDSLAGLQPWFADVSLSLLEDVQSGAVPAEGVEQEVLRISPPRAARRALETVDEQVEMLAGAPLSDQVASLDETLKEISDDPRAFSRVLDEWMAGDIAALQKDVLAPIAGNSPEVYRRLITDRNRRWTASLAQRLRGDGEVVVIVGMGHLIGPAGVPALLRAQGFVVTGP